MIIYPMDGIKTLNVSDAFYMGGYQIVLSFNDGEKQTIDFQPFLISSHHPSVRAFLDPVRFSQFELRRGELIWGDYELCFPIMDLYNNKLLHDGEHLFAA